MKKIKLLLVLSIFCVSIHAMETDWVDGLFVHKLQETENQGHCTTGQFHYYCPTLRERLGGNKCCILDDRHDYVTTQRLEYREPEEPHYNSSDEEESKEFYAEEEMQDEEGLNVTLSPEDEELNVTFTKMQTDDDTTTKSEETLYGSADVDLNEVVSNNVWRNTQSNVSSPIMPLARADKHDADKHDREEETHTEIEVVRFGAEMSEVKRWLENKKVLSHGNSVNTKEYNLFSSTHMKQKMRIIHEYLENKMLQTRQLSGEEYKILQALRELFPNQSNTQSSNNTYPIQNNNTMLLLQNEQKNSKRALEETGEEEHPPKRSFFNVKKWVKRNRIEGQDDSPQAKRRMMQDSIG